MEFLPYVVSILGAIISYAASCMKSRNDLKAVEESNKHEIEKLMEQHKLDLDALERTHQMEIEKINLEHQHQMEMKQVEFNNQFSGEIIKEAFKNPEIQRQISEKIQQGTKSQKKNGVKSRP